MCSAPWDSLTGLGSIISTWKSSFQGCFRHTLALQQSIRALATRERPRTKVAGWTCRFSSLCFSHLSCKAWSNSHLNKCAILCARPSLRHSTAREISALIPCFPVRLLARSSPLALSVEQPPFKRLFTLKFQVFPGQGAVSSDAICAANALPFAYFHGTLQRQEAGRSWTDLPERGANHLYFLACSDSLNCLYQAFWSEGRAVRVAPLHILKRQYKDVWRNWKSPARVHTQSQWTRFLSTGTMDIPGPTLSILWCRRYWTGPMRWTTLFISLPHRCLMHIIVCCKTVSSILWDAKSWTTFWRWPTIMLRSAFFHWYSRRCPHPS